MLSKGKISSIAPDGKSATVAPYVGGIVTAELVIPFHLIGILAIGDPVIYSMFEDNTGIVLHKEDGSGKAGESGGGSGDSSGGGCDCNIYATVENGVLVVRATGGGSGTGTGGGSSFSTDETLTLSPDGVLSVNTAEVVEKDNTLPVTSAAVHTAVGNIEALMKLI